MASASVGTTVRTSGVCEASVDIELIARRFQQAEYAPIAIVQTEKKGFGVRASADLPACVR